jgi:hypothetical protein
MQAKFAYGDLILSSSQFLLLIQQPMKMTLAMKVIKIDSKIIISLPISKTDCCSCLQHLKLGGIPKCKEYQMQFGGP